MAMLEVKDTTQLLETLGKSTMLLLSLCARRFISSTLLTGLSTKVSRNAVLALCIARILNLMTFRDIRMVAKIFQFNTVSIWTVLIWWFLWQNHIVYRDISWHDELSRNVTNQFRGVSCWACLYISISANIWFRPCQKGINVLGKMGENMGNYN